MVDKMTRRLSTQNEAPAKIDRAFARRLRNMLAAQLQRHPLSLDSQSAERCAKDVAKIALRTWSGVDAATAPSFVRRRKQHDR